MDFAFIIHPLTSKDFTRKFPWLDRLPSGIVENGMSLIPPIKAAEINGIRSKTGVQTRGWFVACPLTPDKIMALPEKRVMKKIIKAGEKAENLGAKIVGLGAFTSVVGDAGITVNKNLNISVTTGNSYTVATALEGVLYTLDKLDLNARDLTLSIVGATGSIGKAAARILGERFARVNLIARNVEKLEALEKELNSGGISSEVSFFKADELEIALKGSEVVISASGSVKELIEPQFLKTGAVICDVARPRDVSEKVAREREDVLVIDGGVVKVPGKWNCNLDFGFPKGTVYACMAETMILALEDREESFSLGRELEIEKIVEIKELADKHGFELAGLRSFERAIPEERFIVHKRFI